MAVTVEPIEERESGSAGEGAFRGREAAGWLARLGRLARGGAWVKGAVNYDEDLHFSTYYLRASCDALTSPLYPGYTALVASYEGFNETYWLLADECRATAAAIVAKAVRRPTWLPRIVGAILRRSDALGGIFRAGTSPETLARASKASLLALYRRHDAANRALYHVARLPEALDRGVSYFTGYLLSHLRARGVPASEASEVFDLLSRPTGPSVLAREIAEFDAIVAFAREHARGLPAAAADGPGRARIVLDPALYRRLEAHRRRWRYLPYHGYGKRELATLDHYVGRLLDQVGNPGALAGGAEIAATSAASSAERAKLLERLRLDRAHQALFDVYPEIGAAKLHRRYAQLRNFYYLDMLMAEIAHRLDVSEWAVRCLRPEEVIASLEAGRLVDRSLLERQGGSVYAILDGEEAILSGEAALEARALFRGKARAGRGRTLEGTVASRGKVEGPCKVVIRADDCRGGFAKGTILVSESTDPDLIRFLRAAGGVLTEQGGVTSHAAIICRELGVPTITGIEGLLERVKDGDWLEVDADRGVVRIARRAGEAAIAASLAVPEASEAGAKARNLALVRSHGFRVPEHVVLPFAEVKRATAKRGAGTLTALCEHVLEALALPAEARLAVRSSCVAEDRDDGSAAGAFESLLGVEPARLAGALRDFVALNSAGREGAAYAGGVIVQRMVEAEVAGVCLTRDARARTDDAVIVEMCAGGNAGITGGTARPDRVVVDRRTGDIISESRRGGALGERPLDVTGLVRRFLTLEARFGRPLDIEWALSGGELFILQARPIVERAAPAPPAARGRRR